MNTEQQQRLASIQAKVSELPNCYSADFHFLLSIVKGQEAGTLHYFKAGKNGQCVTCGSLKLWQYHVDEEASILSTGEIIEAFCDKWGWIPEPAMLLDLGERINSVATSMRSLCVEKVVSIPAKNIVRTTTEEVRGATSFKSDVLRALESVSIHGQEKQ